MKAVAYREAGGIDRAEALIDVDLPMPVPQAQDLLVKVLAVSVNPVDAKVRSTRAPQAGEVLVCGWDACGVIEAVGEQVKRFKVGDRVFYAGDINRQGSNAEYHVVDERIVGHAPKTLSDAESAAMPLTSITAWEILFDRLSVPRGGGQNQTLLIVGGAGGVGSMLIQLARQLTQLKVIATASRDESIEWCAKLGAHHVVDHRQPLQPQLAKLGVQSVDRIASLTHTSDHWPQLVELAAPFGRIAMIDDLKQVDLSPLKRKSLSVHWEYMFTRPTFATQDMAEQGRLLDRVAALVEAGSLRTTLSEILQPINASNMIRAHQRVESGTMCGKLVVQGFEG